MISDIAFSQVREDWRIEWQVLDRITPVQPGPALPVPQRLRVLLVASGGCTALSLLAHPRVGTIDAIDQNPTQLHLVELRRQALRHLSLPEQFVLIASGADDRGAIRSAIYDRLRLHLPSATQTFWDQRREEICFGVNQVGRFEQLFRELSQAFTEAGLAPFTDPPAAIASPHWHDIFAQVFDRQKLIQTFGEAAVNYSMDRSFGEHFAAVFAQAIQRFQPSTNYFLTQVWTDRYEASGGDLPLYLQATAQANLKAKLSQLQLHQGRFVEQIEPLAQSAPYDLIQFSNLSDWMPLPELNAMLQTIQTSLKPGGAVIGRRLNGDHNLAEVMAHYFTVDDRRSVVDHRDFSQALQAGDRSFFYSEVVVGWR